MNILLLSFLACGEKETEDIDLNIELNDPDPDTDTNDTGEETDPDTEEVEDPLAIIGNYEDNWGGFQSITNTLWSSDSFSFDISQYNNELHTIIAQNSENNEYNPELWSKFQWTYDFHNNLFYCQVAFEAATEDDAIATEPANPEDLGTGCGGFSWTMLREPLSISGNYINEFQGNIEISSFRWSETYDTSPQVFHIIEIHDNENYVLAQNDVGNIAFGNAWSRFEWVLDTEGLYYCHAAFNAETPEEASQATVDNTDITAGCNGDRWISITPVSE